jgi:hypothetical protein
MSGIDLLDLRIESGAESLLSFILSRTFHSRYLIVELRESEFAMPNIDEDHNDELLFQSYRIVIHNILN